MENVDFENLINETQSKPCGTCKSKKGFNSKHMLMITICSYILISSVYGTIKLINNLISLITH